MTQVDREAEPPPEDGPGDDKEAGHGHRGSDAHDGTHAETHGDGHGHAHDHGHGHAHDHGHGHARERGPVRRLLARATHLVRPHSHDHADRVDHALESSRLGIRSVAVSFAVLLVTAALQAAVTVASGSVGLLGDSLHNVADALTALPLAIAFTVGRRPPTRSYTHGFGRAEDVAGIVVVLLIAASSVAAALEAVRRLIHPHRVDHLALVAVAAVVGFAGNEIVARHRIRVGRQIGSAALVADGLHARTDGFTSLSVLLGVAGVALGLPAADPVVGLLIAIAIAFVLRDAAREVYRRLMDAVDPALVDRAEELLLATPGVRGVSELRLRWIGHALRAEAGVTLAPNLPLVAAHRIAHEAEHELLHGMPRLSAALVHVEPASAAAGTAHSQLDHHR